MPDTTRTYEDLQAGDTVLTLENRDKLPRIRTVERTTKTQIVIDNATRFNRKTGRVVGGDTWSTTVLLIPTAEEIHKARLGLEKRRLADTLSRYRWGTLPLETLRAVRELIDQSQCNT